MDLTARHIYQVGQPILLVPNCSLAQGELTAFAGMWRSLSTHSLSLKY